MGKSTALSASDLGKSITDAMKNIVLPAAAEAKDCATNEGKKLAQTLVDIARMSAAGTVNDEQAGLLLDMQKQASRAVLLSVAGIGIITAEQAINAGLQAVAGAVNQAVGFPLI